MHLLLSSLTVLLLFYLKTASSISTSVIIVGAGSSGVAAASRLLDHGYKNFTVLEAENRIGGRINSVFFGDAYVDIGAQWCHGEKGNIVYNMVKELNILRHTDFPINVYHSSKKNTDQKFWEELYNIAKGVYESDVDKNEGVTLGHYFIEKYNSVIHEKYEKNSEKMILAQESVDLFHHVLLSSEGSFNWFHPSAKSDYKVCDGDQNLNWNGLGYKTILEVLMKKFPDPSKALPVEERILLNKEVVKVLWNESSTVTVICSDGTVLEADHLIFTPSVGVLKDKHAKMFAPPLPKKKQEAIRDIGIGAVMKVHMHFKDTWWNTDLSSFHFVWDEDDKKQLFKEFPEGPLKEGRSWLTDFFTVEPAEENPNVLTAWLTGDMIPQIELMSNETVTRGIEYVLNKFLGHKYNVTSPDSILKSSWYTNPHFRGTYSFQTIESRKNNVSAETELAKPLLNIEGRPIVMFAGEASHPYLYSTVHGAIETGYREADRIIDLHKSN